MEQILVQGKTLKYFQLLTHLAVAAAVAAVVASPRNV
jgi:hypothetical protein